MTEVVLVELTDENRQAMLKLALSMYLGETCPYCMVKFETLDDLHGSVWNGPTEYGRIAHGDCWRKAHPEAAVNERRE